MSALVTGGIKVKKSQVVFLFRKMFYPISTKKLFKSPALSFLSEIKIPSTSSWKQVLVFFCPKYGVAHSNSLYGGHIFLLVDY